MKSYDIGSCKNVYCNYYDTKMELNCAYSDDNSKCAKELQQYPHMPESGDAQSKFDKFIQEQTTIPQEYVDIVSKNFWDLF